MLIDGFREILSVQLIALTGGIIAGTFLAFLTDQISLIPGLLILLPGFLEMRGNISGTLAARISSGLLVSAVKPKIKKNRILKGNVYAAFLMSLFISIVLGIFAYIFSMAVFGIGTIKIIFISLFAAILSNLILVPFTIGVIFLLFRKHHDPTNSIGPYISTLGDIVSIFSLLIVVTFL